MELVFSVDSLLFSDLLSVSILDSNPHIGFVWMHMYLSLSTCVELDYDIN